MINLEDILLDSATCELSRVALSTPVEFLKQRFVKQERRKFLAEPEPVTGFGSMHTGDEAMNARESQAIRNAAAIDQDWSDARASVNRRLQLEDLYEVMDAICDQLLGARRIGADAAELGAVLVAGIETFLNDKADYAVPNAPCRQAERSDPVLVSLLESSIERARQ